jgi:Cd(II)/Pb(II)-responsive transcriptional regulator
MRIGELAARTQTPTDTIRYYERLGLLPKPGRTTANYRSYSTAQVERLNFIRRCRGLDMSLQEVRSLLVFCDQPELHCDEVNETIEEHIRHVDGRIAELRRLAKELRELRAACRAPGEAGNCRILTTLQDEPARHDRSARGHLGSSHRDLTRAKAAERASDAAKRRRSAN